MNAGAVISERFEIQRRAGTGGMSVVYRAVDRATGEPCALKILTGTEPRMLERFEREARVLAELNHPGIVRYVAHGVTDGDRFLAMEWLDGEDLSERLARAPLGIADVITLARGVAEALGFAHGRGVVHRDIKPSNLLLCDGRLDRVKIVDFGIARLVEETDQPTRTGVRIGTPAFMSPEQARGLPKIDERSDVFSLGCVLYQCLTGRRAFAGDDIMAVLAKILLDEPAPVERLRPDTPAGLAALVTRMLAKIPAERPRDGRDVAVIASRLADDQPAAAPGAPTMSALTVGERRLAAVILTRVPIDPTTIDRAVRVERLKDGTTILLIPGTEAATDLAARAARIALAVHAAGGGAVALATGRAVVSAELPVGDVIERATRLLRAVVAEDSTTEGKTVRPASPEALAIRVDEVTAGLLDARFELSGDVAGLTLVAEHATDHARTLLGRPTPCVGRDPELTALTAVYEACLGGEARVVLITAGAGAGKSRVRYELLRRLAQRADHEIPEVWFGRGDPMSAGAPFGVLGAALRRAANIRDGEPLEVRHHKLRARVARHVPDAEVARVTTFLGELIGAPFDDTPPEQSEAEVGALAASPLGRGQSPRGIDVQLHAARQDARLMGDQMRRAWEDLVLAEAGGQPLVLVLEDFHWGDAPTVSFVDAALRRLREQPFLVLALARPEAHDRFPRLWVERDVQEIRLGDLPRRAAERLIREVLGDAATPEVIARLIDRAAGNAFYLEELLRAAAEGKDDVPETVLSMVQARLEGMEAEARRVLRAASVFGSVFWTGGVVELLGGATRAAQVDEWLGALAAREVVTPRAGGRFPGEAEYVFRHNTVREAAYAMLTDADRALGHRLAGGWLARVGEPSPTALAEHLERGGETHAAVAWWSRAAEQALGGNDLPAVLTACERAVACGAAGEALGTVRLLQAEAHVWRAEYAEAERAADAAMRWLPRDGDAWYLALEQAANAAYSLGERERLVEHARALGPPQRTPARIRAAARMIPHLYYAGQPAEAGALWAELRGLDATAHDPSLAVAILAARGSVSLFEGDAAGHLEHSRAVIAACELTGDLRRAQQFRGSVGYACLELGRWDEAVHELREALQTSRRLGLHSLAAVARQNLGLALAHTGALDEARAEESLAAAEFVESGNRRMEAASRYYLGHIRMMAGDLVGAEKTTRAAVEMALGPPMLPPIRAEGLAILAAILLAQGRAAEALEAAAEAARLLDEMGGIDGGEAIIRLSHAEALRATGDVAGAIAAIATARQRLVERASRIRDAGLRARFLEAVPENARTLALAHVLLTP